MALGTKIKGLFKKLGSVDVSTEEGRARALQQTWEESKRLLQTRSSKTGTEVALQPVENLVALFKQQGREELEVWRAMYAFDQHDAFFRQHLVKRICLLGRVPQEDLSALEAQARYEARNLSHWRRLLEDTRFHEEDMRLLKVQESIVLTLRRFFPDAAESTWYDVETEGDARALYEANLQEVAVGILDAGRADQTSQTILETAAGYFPHNLRFRSGLARLLSRSGASDSKSLTMMLEALTDAPDDPELLRNAGALLAKRRGHEVEGLEMLIEIHEREPEDDSILHDIVSTVRRVSEPEEEHLSFVQTWIDRHPFDEENAYWLTDFFLSRNEVFTDRSQAALKAAVRIEDEKNANSDVQSHRYRLAWGRACSGNEDWDGTIEALQQLLQEGELTAEVVIPLSRAYAVRERIDRLAVTAYQCAVELGMDDPFVRDQVCRFFFTTNSDDEIAVTQFRAAMADGGSKWAELGLIREELRSGKPVDHVEKVLAMLQADPENESLIELAGEALAETPTRPNLRRVMGLSPATSLKIFEHSADLRPDALLLVATLAKYRLSNGKRDERTERLLGDICRRDPEELELRIARADLLYDLDQKPLARQLYQEILDRMRNGSSSHSLVRISLDEVDRIEARIVELVAQDENPEQEELVSLSQSAMVPDAQPETVLKVAEAIAPHEFEHPVRMALLERALALDPGNERIEVAVALGRAGKGNPRPALQLALAQLRQRKYDWATSLLHEAALVMKREHVTEDLRKNFLEIAFRHATLPDDLLVEIARLMVRGGIHDPRLVRLYERAIAIEPNDQLVRRGILEWDKIQDSKNEEDQEDWD